MKRHPSLIPLSHEHHDILVVAQGLILGQSPAPRSDWPSDRRAQADRVVTFNRRTLRSHFEVEEAHLFLAVRTHLPDAAGLVAELTDEHEAIQARIRNLEQDPTSTLTVRLPELGRLLETHVRREERVLFETMQREMTPAALESLGTQLKSALPNTGSCRVD